MPAHLATLAVVEVGRPNSSTASFTQPELAQICNSAAVTVPHAPEPLQVVWQLATVQASCGSDPAGTGQHVPTFPATLQALHPLQAAGVLSQHTPSTQLPETHSLPLPHQLPRAFFGRQLGAAQ